MFYLKKLHVRVMKLLRYANGRIMQTEQKIDKFFPVY